MNGGEVLNRLMELVGKEKTLDILAARGGEQVYFPAPENLHEGHWLTRLLDFEAAVKVAAAFASLNIVLPLGPEHGNRNRLQKQVRAAHRSGLSVNEVVRETGLHGRTVRRILNRNDSPKPKMREIDPRQLRLFELETIENFKNKREEK